MLQEDKAKLERDLAALQARSDTRDVQFQDAVRQLNISKFMLAESDDARSQVKTDAQTCSKLLHCTFTCPAKLLAS